ncbi:nucleoside hydrolase [Rhizobium puerariae]|uniref:Nucleoside hydrolase n=1 Tax=Rhizobium puerariae TaxID=1585791 RepID=A0ABV6AJB7_9HYPH
MHFLLDGDPGHDDMLTLYLAAKHVNVVGLTTTFGNSSVEHTTRNALRCLQMGNLNHIPVAKGSVRPLVNEPRYAPHIHGDTGLDGAELPEATVDIQPLHAVDFIIEQSFKYDDLVLVPTGPLTNVASALIKDPTLAKRLKGISLMGGSLTFGNTTPAAELNIYLDPEAADVVFRSGVPIKMFGLNVTRMANATKERIADIRAIGTPFAATVADLIEYYRMALNKAFGLEGASLHDPLAIAVFIAPELFTLKKMNVQIELNGKLTRGMTVCDYRSSDGRRVKRDDAEFENDSAVVSGFEENVEVAVDMDVDGFFKLLNETLAMYQ